ncbi:HEPN domain-containing protein [Trinickia sp. EG282A]|uniref:HEPN domain-containing protein n=1 Tax=Trinickia sp. EG282A TaxID=3237013 RepID=UPI0034D34355
MTVSTLLLRAERAAESADMLLKAGDTTGACNRAYYAMFDAARAALVASGSITDIDNVSTHQGVIGMFGKHLVAAGKIDRQWGRAFNNAEAICIAADYTFKDVDADEAKFTVERANEFVQLVRDFCLRIHEG